MVFSIYIFITSLLVEWLAVAVAAVPVAVPVTNGGTCSAADPDCSAGSFNDETNLLQTQTSLQRGADGQLHEFDRNIKGGGEGAGEADNNDSSGINATSNWLTLQPSKATMSSEAPVSWGAYWRGAAGRAVDGNRATSWHSGSCTQTNLDVKPWWQVELDGTYKIEQVELTPFTGSTYVHLKNFNVTVGNSLCATAGHPTHAIYTVHCSGYARGKTVKIQVPTTEHFIICEVRIKGVKSAWEDFEGILSTVDSQIVDAFIAMYDDNKDTCLDANEIHSAMIALKTSYPVLNKPKSAAEAMVSEADTNSDQKLCRGKELNYALFGSQ